MSNTSETDSRNQYAIVVMGVSGCGKSSAGRAIASSLNAEFIEADDLHPQANIKKMENGIPLNDEDRQPWLLAVCQQAQKVLNSSGRCVIACSALRERYRQQLRSINPATYFVYLEGSRSVIWDRMNQRSEHFMPPALLDSQFETLEPPTAEDAVVTVSIESTVEEITQQSVTLLKSRYKL